MKFFGTELKFNGLDIWHKGILGVFSTTSDGLVPKTTTSNTTDFLRRDGSWATPSYPTNADTVDGKHASDFATSTHTHNELAAIIKTMDSGASYANQYTKLAMFEVTAQYGYAAHSYAVAVGGHGSSSTEICTLNIWIKCQAALGQDGIMSITVSDKGNTTVDLFDYYIVEVSKTATKNTYELYIKNKSGYTSASIHLLSNIYASCTRTHYSSVAYVTALPAGRSVQATNINNAHTHTKSQITDMPTKLSDFTNDIGAGGGIKITTSTTAPTTYSPGDFWYKQL